MASTQGKGKGASTILVTTSSWEAAGIFNANEWQQSSKGIVQSCGSELSTIQHGVRLIAAICEKRTERCAQHLKTLDEQWTTRKWKLEDSRYFAEDPDLHLSIEGFFSGLKTLLDLIAQLLSSEHVVGAQVHAFHRDGDSVGGKVLKVLQGNVKKGKEEVAKSLASLIIKHKHLWIDDVTRTRDLLIHPPRGSQQVMFELLLAERDGKLHVEIAPPTIGALTIADYAARQLESMKGFAKDFIQELRRTAGTGASA